MNYKFKNFSILIPVHNEEKILFDSMEQIYAFCLNTKLDFEIIFSENGSNDKTIELLNKISKDKKECKFISNNKPNYGKALKDGLIESNNELVVIFDIDYFSENFLKESLTLDNEYSAIIGSKRLADSNDNRGFSRVLISSIYAIILKIIFGTKLSDTHGMKAFRKSAYINILKEIKSDQWMFDTELLLRIERSGEKIKETPVIVNEIRPSVYNISFDIPKTLFLIFKLRVKLLLEND
tara:strand:- start:144 stop:857 length:714 start_codon:yes stop_codon:yes gene_type:complete